MTHPGIADLELTTTILTLASSSRQTTNTTTKKPYKSKTSLDERDTHSTKPKERKKDPNAVALGRKGGEEGGPARAHALSPTRREAIARHAAHTRWGTADPHSTGASEVHEQHGEDE